MDDPSRTPRDSDRAALRDRIKRAVADGRISAADGDIRLRNVDAAHSLGELDLIVRDLDQLESVIAPASAYPAPAAGSPTRSRAWVPALVVALVLAVVGAGLGAVLLFRSSGDPQVATPLNDPLPLTASPSASPSADTTDPTAAPTADATVPAGDPAAAPYRLSAEGVRSFIRTYRERFGTTRTVSATFYGDYVVVQVPVGGGTRHAGWVYRESTGFTDFGGTSTNFPGSAVVDLRRLDVAALMTNLARARRVLHVENPDQAYVTIDYRPQFDPAPNVNIYVSNAYNESGYLATRLNGQVERAYPFGG